MDHIRYIKDLHCDELPSFFKRATGSYYTSESVGKALVTRLLAGKIALLERIKVVDPFAGDGRLIKWLLQTWQSMGLPNIEWDIELWDCDNNALAKAQESLSEFAVKLSVRNSDSFKIGLKRMSDYDLVLTNPPWEILKPDRRELKYFESEVKINYVQKLKMYDRWLGENYPISQPNAKFAGWGTNLSRVGLELALKLTRKGGYVGIVLPSSFLADQQSVQIRKMMFRDYKVDHIFYYPAESKQYTGADVTSISMLLRSESVKKNELDLAIDTYREKRYDEVRFKTSVHKLASSDYVVPVSFGSKAIKSTERISANFPKWLDLEHAGILWAGRELDETKKDEWLDDSIDSEHFFVKGRMIERYRICNHPTHKVSKKDWNAPASTKYNRIVWRDVSRPNQKRRITAAIIPEKWVAGNSLNVAHVFGYNQVLLKNLLAVMNSFAFEFQLRSFLSTSHISLGAVRKVGVPNFDQLKSDSNIAELVENYILGDNLFEYDIDARVAKYFYDFNIQEYSSIIQEFPKISVKEKSKYLEAFDTI